jgi:hypothetical protein
LQSHARDGDKRPLAENQEYEVGAHGAIDCSVYLLLGVVCTDIVATGRALL